MCLIINTRVGQFMEHEIKKMKRTLNEKLTRQWRSRGIKLFRDEGIFKERQLKKCVIQNEIFRNCKRTHGLQAE